MKPKAITLRLTLCATACALALSLVACRTLSRPSVMPATATELGNAFRLRLPAGTQLILADQETADQVRALAINELDLARSSGRTVVLARPLQLVSPAYIAQRNRSEVALLTLIEELTTENARLRSK